MLPSAGTGRGYLPPPPQESSQVEGELSRRHVKAGSSRGVSSGLGRTGRNLMRTKVAVQHGLQRWACAGSAMWGERGGCPMLGWAARQASLPPPFPLPPLQSADCEELSCSRENSRENLLHQAMQNSGIVLDRVAGEESTLQPAPPSGSSPQSLGDGAPELPLLEVEQIETVGFCYRHAPDGADPMSASHGRWG